jgi:hypothetical protein
VDDPWRGYILADQAAELLGLSASHTRKLLASARFVRVRSGLGGSAGFFLLMSTQAET